MSYLPFTSNKMIIALGHISILAENGKTALTLKKMIRNSRLYHSSQSLII